MVLAARTAIKREMLNIMNWKRMDKETKNSMTESIRIYNEAKSTVERRDLISRSGLTCSTLYQVLTAGMDFVKF